MSRRSRLLPRGWYPFDGVHCRREIESYLKGWSPPPQSGRGLAGIVPHAGWTFSGRLAARVFATLKSVAKEEIDTVVVYGGHLGPDDVPRTVTEDSWETPLGDIQMDSRFLERIMKKLDLKKESPSSADNTIEVQLPMVKYFFAGSKLLALRSPLSPKAAELGRKVAEIASQEKISIVAIGSTDLTHYGPNYGFLPKGIGPSSVDWVRNENDREWIDCALRMDVEGLLQHGLQHDSACSAGAAASAIATSRALGADHGILLGYHTSYEIMPDDSFVGYAGIVY